MTTKYGSKIAADIANTFVIFFPQQIVILFQADEDYYQELIRKIAVGKVRLKFLGGQNNEFEWHSLVSKKN